MEIKENKIEMYTIIYWIMILVCSSPLAFVCAAFLGIILLVMTPLKKIGFTFLIIGAGPLIFTWIKTREIRKKSTEINNP